jgi:hypothetical protein
MAGEINYGAKLSINRGNLQHQFTPSGLLLDLNSDQAAGGNQVIGGTAEALTFNGDVAAFGMAYFRNLSTAIAIDISKATNTTTFDPLIRLLPGEYSIIRGATTNIWAKASTSGTNTAATLQYMVFSP